MKRRLFGTDGVRGTANRDPMTAEMALALGQAVAHVFQRHRHERHRIIIGKDTRLSGYLFENAMAAGICSMGGYVLLVGPMPTPAMAFLTADMRCDAGVMISASHNPFQDNGIKFFSRDGFKLDDTIEERIENLIFSGALSTQRAEPAEVGQAQRIDDAQGRYVVFLKKAFPIDLTLDGLRVVLDCANGAAYRVGPTVLEELGAEVFKLGISPNGRNINDGCGSTSPQLLQLTVPGVRADVGIALDGDGDRLVMADHFGRVLDGDQLLYIMATARQAEGTLRGPIVGTVMSNLGLELALREQGIGFRRAQVGDRYVLSLLRETGGELGGETSGHILTLDKTTTGDAIVAALQVLAVMRRAGRPLAELAAAMPRFPQVMINVRVARRTDPMQVSDIAAGVERIGARLGDEGRIVLRASGTEPVIRVMVECRDGGLAKSSATELAELVRRAIA
jgi:phosphoglucosamine mutase